jgi:3-hydroxyacyl-CoA dehydrogenase/enoyl-CoA hydratase/3-hydroxybutyryl-CoA epimerase/3-hydroxyacyl-CoA dehydrogenase/enoyl-CoA hydratase/3-hydroxybutyryl-CoA epimerase/enoyl-CoA isomerase
VANSSFRLEATKKNFGILTFDQPGSRANTLGRPVLAELDVIVSQLEKRHDLQGLVFRSGKPGMFIAGADIKELSEPSLSRELVQQLAKMGLDLFGRLERLPFPTVAAIDGSCMGGGLELALSLDYRLASTHPKTELACPEVKLGIIPGWGGTQRLPRVIGPSIAAEMICAGEGAKPERAQEIGLVVDTVPAESLLAESMHLLEWARQSDDWKKQRLQKQQPVGLTEDQYSFFYAVAKAQVMAKTKGRLPAPLAALEAIAQGCNLPLDEALAIESSQFVPLVGSPISRNLIAVFFMGQRLQKDPGVAEAPVEPKGIEKVGVLGAGLMGAGIAAAHIQRNLSVTMLDSVLPALEKGTANITKILQGRVDSGRITAAQMVSSLGKLSTTQIMEALADRDLVIEAIVENEKAKLSVLGELQSLLPADAIIASNTSTISISRMARAVSHPENFAGMHFFNPVDRMQLVEVIRGENSSDRTIASLVALAKRIGKTPIVVKDCPGFLVNRILFMYLNESLLLLEQGAEPRALDKAATDFGMPMGPVALNDLVGLDTSLYAGQVINSAFPDRAVNSRILEALVKIGRLGQKSGAGFYSYAKDSRGADDPSFAALLDQHRRQSREFTQKEITDRLFLPMLTEASRILEEAIVRDPGDVDMGMILGTGFPSAKGGLLGWADMLGLGEILERLSHYKSLGKRFQPTDQMRRLAAEKRGFYS